MCGSSALKAYPNRGSLCGPVGGMTGTAVCAWDRISSAGAAVRTAAVRRAWRRESMERCMGMSLWRSSEKCNALPLSASVRPQIIQGRAHLDGGLPHMRSAASCFLAAIRSSKMAELQSAPRLKSARWPTPSGCPPGEFLRESPLLTGMVQILLASRELIQPSQWEKTKTLPHRLGGRWWRSDAIRPSRSFACFFSSQSWWAYSNTFSCRFASPGSAWSPPIGTGSGFTSTGSRFG